MREIGIEENKRIQLDILNYFINFCSDNNLRYFLAYGSLIGAVRHSGFIPWDDDIDVQMPRDDYERLIKSFDNHDYYSLVSPYDDNAKHSYVKIVDTRTIKIEKGVDYNNNYLGIDIDVFPLDGQPTSQQKYELEFKKIKKVYKKIYYQQLGVSSVSPRKRVLLQIYKLFIGKRSSLIISAKKILVSNDYNSSSFVGDISSLYSVFNDRHPKEDYEDIVNFKFEHLIVNAPIGYDKILKRIYGNYKELPPIEKRTSHHVYKVYWKD